MEEIEIAEQEGYTAVYRKLKKKRKKKHRRRNGSSTGKKRDSKETMCLSPFIVGARPLPTLPTQQKYGMNTKLYKNDINKLVRDTLEEIGGSHISTKSSLPEQGGRFFLGECTFDDDITSILQTTRICKFKKTGRKVSINWSFILRNSCLWSLRIKILIRIGTVNSFLYTLH